VLPVSSHRFSGPSIKPATVNADQTRGFDPVCREVLTSTSRLNCPNVQLPKLTGSVMTPCGCKIMGETIIRPSDHQATDEMDSSNRQPVLILQRNSYRSIANACIRRSLSCPRAHTLATSLAATKNASSPPIGSAVLLEQQILTCQTLFDRLKRNPRPTADNVVDTFDRHYSRTRVIQMILVPRNPKIFPLLALFI
jgi:hypothetical protein